MSDIRYTESEAADVAAVLHEPWSWFHEADRTIVCARDEQVHLLRFIPWSAESEALAQRIVRDHNDALNGRPRLRP